MYHPLFGGANIRFLQKDQTMADFPLYKGEQHHGPYGFINLSTTTSVPIANTKRGEGADMARRHSTCGPGATTQRTGSAWRGRRGLSSECVYPNITLILLTSRLVRELTLANPCQINSRPFLDKLQEAMPRAEFRGDGVGPQSKVVGELAPQDAAASWAV